MGASAAERVRSGYEVAILGSPNAGKSTLLNALAGRDAAITSDIAGTTRDIVEVRMDLGGLPVTLLDTAGLRETDDLIEGLGIAKAKERATNCDLRVFLDTDENTFEDIKRPGDLVVKAKSDLSDSDDFGVSGVTGEGIPELISEITDILSTRAMTAGLAIRERHVAAFSTSKQSVETSDQTACTWSLITYDIVAEELRTAVRALESVVGLVDVENLLDVIFSSFCVGK
ncbi:tRNA modification GTPase MnmE [Nymphon striatum]|nr:tRNA modification GTPase MnmE [Nymphon striatum]